MPIGHCYNNNIGHELKKVCGLVGVGSYLLFHYTSIIEYHNNIIITVCTCAKGKVISFVHLCLSL